MMKNPSIDSHDLAAIYLVIFAVGLLSFLLYAHLKNIKRKRERLRIAKEILEHMRRRKVLTSMDFSILDRKIQLMDLVPGRWTGKEVFLYEGVSCRIEQKRKLLTTD